MQPRKIPLEGITSEVKGLFGKGENQANASLLGTRWAMSARCDVHSVDRQVAEYNRRRFRMSWPDPYPDDMRTRLGLVVGLVGCFGLVACGSDDPVSESAPVGLSMKVQSSDVAGDGTITEDKSITTESGNPWGAFITAARDAIGGDPSDIVLDTAVLTLQPSSTNIADLSELFDGSVSLGFEMNGSKTVFAVADGVVSGTDLGTELALETRFDFDALTTDDVADLLGGSFKVVLTGQTAAGFAGLDADADLDVVLTFSAFE